MRQGDDHRADLPRQPFYRRMSDSSSGRRRPRPARDYSGHVHNRRTLLLDSSLAIGLAVVSAGLFLLTGSADLTGLSRGGAAWTIPMPDPVVALLAALAAAPVAVRRRRPLTAMFATILPQAALALLGYDCVSLAWLTLLYSAAAYRGLAVALSGLAASLLAYAGLALFPPSFDWLTHLLQLAALTGAWGLGRGVRLRRAYLTELRERAVRLEQAREADTRAARAEERTRIARELHDVVAHHVSVMTVQAAAARRVLTADPGQAREALSAIESTGRVAMREMRELVGVLRAPAERAPRRGTAALPTLVEQMCEAGLPTELVVEGDAEPLPAGVDLAAYRLVQEGLTNSLRHAGAAAHAVVTVRHRPDELGVEVLDDGRGQPARPEETPGERNGHGLVGIRERVAIYGGILKVGPRPGGGFEIRARFPLT